MSNKNSNSNTYSVIAMVLGGIAVLFFPPFLGGAGVILAVIGKQKNEKLWSIGLAASIKAFNCFSNLSMNMENIRK